MEQSFQLGTITVTNPTSTPPVNQTTLNTPPSDAD
jgi:hypothetical protein